MLSFNDFCPTFALCASLNLSKKLIRFACIPAVMSSNRDFEHKSCSNETSDLMGFLSALP